MEIRVRWLAEEYPGSETLTLSVGPELIRAAGEVVGLHEGRPFQASYLITCNAAWQVQSVQVESRFPEVARLSLVRHQSGLWLGTPEADQFTDCTEVDLSVTPFTNTLPIRRLRLAPGESRQIDVIWIGVPDLALRRVQQRYTNLGEQRYRYEALDGAGQVRYMAELFVDEHGLVHNYPGLFRRHA